MKTSAGILMYRLRGGIEVFLVHPGGPFWKNKDAGAWSIPKGEVEGDESLLDRARMEFKEETGTEVNGDFIALTPIKQKSGKTVHAWAVEGDIDADNIVSNTIDIDWPPKSGRKLTIAEVDRGAWFTVEEALIKINPAQVAFVLELVGLSNNK